MEFFHFILELVKNPLLALGNFIEAHGSLTYGLLFAIVFAETGLIVFPILPGDSLLFSIGVLASATGKLDLMIVIPMLIAAALLGDNLNYAVGRYFSEFIKSRERILFLKRSHIEQTEAYYAKHGGQTVIMARFIPIVRTVAPFVAGAGSMKYSKYISFCIVGAIIWVTGISLLGYMLGSNEWVKANFEKVVLGIVFISVLPMIVGYLRTRFSKPQA
jgi:membrane-associated protein